MHKQEYSSTQNVPLPDATCIYVEPEKLYGAIHKLEKRHGNFQVVQRHSGPTHYLLPTGLVTVVGLGDEDNFPHVFVESRSKEGLKRILSSLSLPNTPKK